MTQNDPLDNWEFEQNASDFLEDTNAEVVAKFFSPLEADLAAAKLRSEGIYCFLSNNASQNVLTQVANMVRLHVKTEDKEKARELLTEFMPEPESSGGSVWEGMLIIFAITIGIGLMAWVVRLVLSNVR